jgi:hypothetical protein
MRRLLFAVLALPLIAATPKGTIALGVGASSSTEVVVKINGKNTTVKLAGVNNGTYAGQAFLQCLVANRIVRVDRAAGRVTMLDGSSVADHVAEFLQTKTTTDPCALGKAAYVSATPPLASSVAVAPPTNANAASAPGKREGHVSFATGTLTSESVAVPSSSSQPQTGQRMTAPPPRPVPTGEQPIYRTAPTVGTTTPGSISTYTPAQAGTANVQSVGTTTVGQTGTYAPPQATTTNIPTTSTNPP